MKQWKLPVKAQEPTYIRYSAPPEMIRQLPLMEIQRILALRYSVELVDTGRTYIMGLSRLLAESISKMPTWLNPSLSAKSLQNH